MREMESGCVDSEPNVPALGSASEKSAVDQRPHDDSTRLVIDAQQSLGLRQGDAEPWHLLVLGLNPAGEFSKVCKVSWGLLNCARKHDVTS